MRRWAPPEALTGVRAAGRNPGRACPASDPGTGTQVNNIAGLPPCRGVPICEARLYKSGACMLRSLLSLACLLWSVLWAALPSTVRLAAGVSLELQHSSRCSDGGSGVHHHGVVGDGCHFAQAEAHAASGLARRGVQSGGRHARFLERQGMVSSLFSFYHFCINLFLRVLYCLINSSA